MSVKLVELIRDSTVESIHRGSIVVVDSNRNILYEAGNAEVPVFFHSSAKPLQAVAALEAGIAEKYGLDLKEIAVMSSSHIGEKEHIDTLKGIMGKIGVNENALLCGIHEPYSKEAAKELILAGLTPSTLHCNCSGKHLGLIAASKAKGLSIEDYYRAEHDIQKEVKKVIAEFSGTSSEDIVTAVDGCGIPVFGLPLKNMALAFANLGNMEFSGGKYSKSQNYVISAMTLYPEMVAGNGRLDTEVIKRFGDRLLIKTGAEAVSCISLLGRATGIALKIDDGAQRAIAPAVLETLLQVGFISREEAESMKDFWIPPVKNNKGEKVGELRADFKLKKPAAVQ